MTLSYSCGYAPKIWKQDRVLWGGPSAYSSMDTSRDGNTLFVLYERGVQYPDEQIHLSQVSTRILGRRTAPFLPFLIPNRAPHGFTPRS